MGTSATPSAAETSIGYSPGSSGCGSGPANCSEAAAGLAAGALVAACCSCGRSWVLGVW